MVSLDHFLIIVFLVALSGFFSMSEISLAAARKVKLQILESEGDIRAKKVLAHNKNQGIFLLLCKLP